MNSKIDALRVELTDMLTDFVYEEANQYICSECSCNVYDDSIGYSECEVDQDLFVCPYANDVGGAIDRAVELIVAALEEAPQDEILF